MDANVVAAPQSVADAAQLVKQLYQPGNPQVISAIQDRLQALQRSPDGWQLADAFLAHEDLNVRFFGALTFTVKLNNDGLSLDEENAKAVLLRLISWLVRLVQQHDSAMVIRKLCTTLVTYLLRASVPWEKPLFHLICSFHHGDAVSPDVIENADVTSEHLIPALSIAQINSLFWFLGALADEVGKIDYSGPAQAKFHVQMEAEVVDASKLMDYGLRYRGEGDIQLKGEALKCYSTWVNYAQPIWPTKPDALQRLRDLLDPATQCLLIDEVESDALDFFIDVLESYTSFFYPSHMDTLASIIQSRFGPQLEESLQEQGGVYIAAGQLIIAYSIAVVEDIVQRPDSERAQVTLPYLASILKTPGFPGEEDELSIVSIEFWNTYIEFVSDVLFSRESDDPPPHWLPHARSLCTELNEMLWQKMWTPPNDITKKWGEPEKEAFRNFRTDSADLLTSIYLFLGRDMLQQFIQFALQSLQQQEWRALEASMYCLNAMADNVLEDQANDDALAALFGSSLFRDIADFTQRIPTQARRTAIDMLGNYGSYIERHEEALPDAMRFLFASLETASFANIAAKSISALCSTCRHNLTGELDGFIAQYQRFLSGPTSDSYTKEKVIGAVAAIAQALQPESAKAGPLSALLENVEKDIVLAKESMAANDVDMAQLAGESALHCLASIGKSMQIPEDIPIDLYAEDPNTPNFWTTEPGLQIQQRITNTFSVLEVLSFDGEAIEAACDVLRSGFTETAPGPFVLPPSVTVSFLQQCTVSTPQIEAVLSTAATLITQHSRPNTPSIPVPVQQIYTHVLSLLSALGTPCAEPGIAHNSLDLLVRLFPVYAPIFLASPQEQISLILTFTLRAVEGLDPFPRRSALDLCSKLIRTCHPSQQSEISAQALSIVTYYGPSLTETLIRQIAGMGQRSELDYVSDTLRALFGTLPAQAKTWTEAALQGERFPRVVTSVGEQEKGRFLGQVSGLRGDRKTRDVVREFYIACRGL